MSRYHCPAFDYNIIQADNLIFDIKKKFKNKLVDYGVEYNPPDSIVLNFNFETERKKFKVAVWWKAVSEYDRFEITEKCWQMRAEYYIKFFDNSSMQGTTNTIMELSNDDIIKHIGESLA